MNRLKTTRFAAMMLCLCLIIGQASYAAAPMAADASGDAVEAAASGDALVTDASGDAALPDISEILPHLPTTLPSMSEEQKPETPEEPSDTSSDTLEAFEAVKLVVSTPKLKSVKIEDPRSVTLTWKQSKNAAGYYIYAKAGSGKWTQIANVKGADQTSKTIKLVTNASTAAAYWCKNIRFRVQAYNDTIKSKYSNEKSKCIEPKKAALKSAQNVDYHTNKITWTGVQYTDGYSVYRRTEGGNWTKLADVSKGTTSYSDTKATAGTKYYYTVRTFWREGSTVRAGKYNETGISITTRVAAPKLLSTSANGQTITINWSRPEGADGYYVMRKTGTGKYRQIAFVDSASTTSYTDKSASGQDTFTYTIVAFRTVNGKNYAGSYDEKGISTGLAAKTVTKTVTDKNSVLYGKKVKLFYASDGSQIQDAQKIVGSGVTYQLYVNRGKNMVTAYVKDGSCYIPVKAFICSTGGSNTPLGTFSTKAKYRWHELMGPCWGQWCTRIHGGVLFHSVYYSTINDNQTLSVSAYNKLGTTASHGCVRLTAASAKWIYDNCPTGATVVIYEKSGYEPLKKPTAYKLSASHRWDPTDPNMAYKCKQNGCH